MSEENTQRVEAQRTKTQRLKEKLAQGKVGDVLTDEELTALIGEDTRPGGRGYQNLLVAIRSVVCTHKIVWERIRRDDGELTGRIKCLDPKEIEISVEKDLLTIRRKTKRSKAKIMTFSAEQLAALPPADRSRVLQLGAQIGTLTLMASRKMENAVGKIDFANQHKPDFAKLLASFPK